MDEEIKSIIEETVNETVLKLKKANLIRGNEKSALQKTEELLKNYKKLKASNPESESVTGKTIKKVESAIKVFAHDDYAGLIEMIYFKNMTREECAEYFGVEPITITRNKRRMVNELKNVLFADDVIKELFL